MNKGLSVPDLWAISESTTTTAAKIMVSKATTIALVGDAKWTPVVFGAPAASSPPGMG
jgi:hypothetical protein